MNELNLKKKGLRASYLISKIAIQANPSSSIKFFEKVVEPILMQKAMKENDVHVHAHVAAYVVCC